MFFWDDTTCHDRTLMVADLRLCGTHFPTTSELSLFVLCLRPSDVCSSLWLRFKKKVLENGGREILKEFKARCEKIEIGVIWECKQKATTTAYCI